MGPPGGVSDTAVGAPNREHRISVGRRHTAYGWVENGADATIVARKLREPAY